MFSSPPNTYSVSSKYAWSYEVKDSLGNVTFTGTDTIVTRVAAFDETIGTETGLLRLEAYSIWRFFGIEKVWYRSTSEKLLEVAYSNASAAPVVLPKKATAESINRKTAISNFFFMPRTVLLVLQSQHVDDSVLIRTDQRLVYRYPFIVGSSWTSFQHPFLQTREVVGFKEIVLQGGVFWCAQIQTRLPSLAPETEWFDFISNEGLIVRTIRHPKLPISSVEDPERILGWVKITERLNLLSHTMP